MSGRIFKSTFEGDSKVTFGHPQTSFFETIDEQSAIVPAQIAEVRIWKNFSLTWTHPNPCTPYRGIARLPVAVSSGLLMQPH